MSNYWKLIGALVGNVVAIILVFLATKGLSVCTIPGSPETCTVFGFSSAQITGAVMAILNMAAVHWFPANTPPAA